MPPRYFKPETMIVTRCEHCGAQHKETMARLYSDDSLICSTCGQEHTAERNRFRRTVDETETLVDSMSDWTARLAAWLRRHWNGAQNNRPF